VDDSLYPVEWAGGQAVVALPEHIGISNAGQIREELLSVINQGPTTLIADMTATISCDRAGADAVTRAWQRAASSGTELRLVVTAQIVARVLGLSGLGRLISVYPSLEAATDARTARREHLELMDTVITGMFHAGLSLQTALDMPADAARQHIEQALADLDGIIRQVRDAVFADQ
jgi:anti-anti-sigma factor